MSVEILNSNEKYDFEKELKNEMKFLRFEKLSVNKKEKWHEW